MRRRVVYAVIAAVALVFVAADTLPNGLAFRNAASTKVLGMGQEQQVLMTPRSTSNYVHQIAKGERIREQHVVEFAARQTLERAKREAAAAVAGEWQPWMGGSGGGISVLPGVGGYTLPARGTFSSGFGPRWGTVHQGIDISAPIGSPIYAAAAGTVIDAGPAQGFGLWVRIRHDDGSITVYGHMYDFFVSVGERVPAGMQIARVGNRGDSTGPHLHFEVIMNGRHVDPVRWLALHGVGIN
ncbi:M23 family metallopeptidase [Aldersonia kunmingensis]|uniref:M23 family metallopeptidase n=1 Tax=Aldersonia kunmingensis TaxID=408066 RepID=UPI000AA1C050